MHRSRRSNVLKRPRNAVRRPGDVERSAAPADVEMNRNRIILIALVIIGSSAHVSAQQHTIQPCGDAFDAKHYVGGRYKLLIPKGIHVRHGADIDYKSYSVGFSVQKKSYWLSGIFGMVAAYVPEDLLKKSTEVTQRPWKRGDFNGLDTKGKLPNGNFWRYFGLGDELIRYEDVPAEAAAFFDGLLDKVCFRDRP
jgi:hypothetical protein